MYGGDREVIAAALDWAGEGRDLALVTVAKGWGSAPRPPGSLMVMNRDGRHVGSVSGGCVEADLLQRYRDGSLAGPLPVALDYGVTGEQAGRLGLPCGGRLELVVETLDSTASLAAVLKAMEEGDRVARRLRLRTGEVSLHPVSADTAELAYDGDTLEKVFGPGWLLLVIGAGQVSRYLAQMALALDYRVVVCDPRAEYAGSWQVPDTEIDTRMPDDAVRGWTVHARSAVVTLSHDPKLDDLALIEALGGAAFYVGALGSRSSSEQRRKRLAELGVAAGQLHRLRAPVGLPIGSRSPAEIAIAILAELTAVRRGLR